MGIEISDLETDLNNFAKIINELNDKATKLQQELENTRNAIIANSGAYQQTQLLIKKIDPTYFDPKEEVVEEETEVPKKKGKKEKVVLNEAETEGAL